MQTVLCCAAFLSMPLAVCAQRLPDLPSATMPAPAQRKPTVVYKKLPPTKKQLGLMMLGAIAKRDTKQVSKLLGLGADANTRDPKGNPALLWATSRRDDAAIIDMLLSHKANPNARGAGGSTAL